jgi:hypothetical protein
MIDEEILSEALLFFRLEIPFTKDELKKKYRELAKKYHPDSGDYTTNVMFLELAKYKNVLDVYWDNQPKTTETEQASDDYRIYKKAKTLENASIYRYFQARKGEKIDLKTDSPELKELRKKLTEVILLYKTLLEKFSGSIWFQDAKESIEKLKIWL